MDYIKAVTEGQMKQDIPVFNIGIPSRFTSRSKRATA